MSISARHSNAAGWPTRMSKPSAAKGVGACLKHVLNTRLPGRLRLVEAQRAEHGGRVSIMATRRGGGGRAPPMSLPVTARQRALPAPRIAAEEPLPPEDRSGARSAASIEDLYQQQAPRLLRFFARRTVRQDAGDLVQESFARLADMQSRTAEEIERPEAYLSRIAANLLRDRAKSALRRSLANHVSADDLPLAGHDPVASLEARDQIQRLQEALAGLAPKTREIFLAHRLDGLPYKEIAGQTGLSPKGVEWHMSKAIVHIDRVLRRR